MRARVDDGRRWRTGSGRAAGAVTEGRAAAGAEAGGDRRGLARGLAYETVWERPLSARWGPCEGRSEVRVQGSHSAAWCQQGSLTGSRLAVEGSPFTLQPRC